MSRIVISERQLRNIIYESIDSALKQQPINEYFEGTTGAINGFMKAPRNGQSRWQGMVQGYKNGRLRRADKIQQRYGNQVQQPTQRTEGNGGMNTTIPQGNYSTMNTGGNTASQGTTQGGNTQTYKKPAGPNQPNPQYTQETPQQNQPTKQPETNTYTVGGEQQSDTRNTTQSLITANLNSNIMAEADEVLNYVNTKQTVYKAQKLRKFVQDIVPVLHNLVNGQFPQQ